MEITQINHRFKSIPKLRRVTQRIIIHHSASRGNEDAATIHRWHLSRGWAGIGYHFVILRNGEIQAGRPENAVGAHAGAKGNWDSIGVCMVGNFDAEEPPPEQMQSLAWLIGDLEDTYGQLKVIRHKDVAATACPGSKFPWEQLRVMVRGGIQDVLDSVNLTVNGRPVQVPLRVINGRTEAMLSGAWVQLRDMASLLQAEIGWDPETKAVNLIIK